jgi:hypothetical protein
MPVPGGPVPRAANVVDGPFTTFWTRLLSSWLSRACRGWVRAACPQAHTGCRSRVARVARTRTGHSGRLPGGSRGRRRPARMAVTGRASPVTHAPRAHFAHWAAPQSRRNRTAKWSQGVQSQPGAPRGAVLARGALSRKTGIPGIQAEGERRQAAYFPTRKARGSGKVSLFADDSLWW